MIFGRSKSLKSAVVANLGLLLMVVTWGSMFPVLERILETWDPLSATVARHTLAVFTMLTVLGLRDRRLPVHGRLPWRRLWVLGFFGMTATSLMTSYSVFLSSGVSTAIAAATNPITSALVARLVQRAPLASGLAVGAVLSTVGGLISIFGGQGAEMQFRGGELLVILANLLWTWYSIMAQRWLAGFSQLQISALTALTGVLCLVAVVAMIGATGATDFRFDLSLEPVILLVYAGAISVAVGNSLWHFAVSRVGVTVAAVFNNLMPIVAVLISLWVGTRPTLVQLVGGAVILAGVIYAQMLALRSRSTQAAASEA